jgi:hypothetical protein
MRATIDGRSADGCATVRAGIRIAGNERTSAVNDSKVTKRGECRGMARLLVSIAAGKSSWHLRMPVLAPRS